jgi:hypothetical protein
VPIPALRKNAREPNSELAVNSNSFPHWRKIRAKYYFFPEEVIVKTNWMFAWIIGAVLVAGTIVSVTTASGQKTASKPSAKLTLTAIDTDHDGTVSKAEFMTYIEAQFDKVDTDHDGTLDAKEFEQLRKNLAAATTR